MCENVNFDYFDTNKRLALCFITAIEVIFKVINPVFQTIINILTVLLSMKLTAKYLNFTFLILLLIALRSVNPARIWLPKKKNQISGNIEEIAGDTLAVTVWIWTYLP